MKDVNLALAQISDIRSQLLGTTRFLAISPGFNALMALLAFGVAVLQSLHAPLQESAAFIACWAVVFIVSSALVAVDTLSRARRLHGVMASALYRATLQRILPFVAAGVFFTWVICRFAVETAWILPGFWLMLMGLQGFSALTTLPRAVVWMAYWYFICGALVLGFAAQTRELSPWMMGVPMTVGQVGVAMIFSRAKGGRHGRSSA